MNIDFVATTILPHPLPSPDPNLILERIQDLQQNCLLFADNSEQYLIGPTGTWCLKDFPITDRHDPVLKYNVLQWEQFSASPKYASIAELLPRSAIFHNPPDVPLARVIAAFITDYALDGQRKTDALDETNSSCDDGSGNGSGDSAGTCTSTTSTNNNALRNHNHAPNTTIVTLIDVGAGSKPINTNVTQTFPSRMLV